MIRVVTYVRSLEIDAGLEHQRYLTDIYPPARGWELVERFEDIGFDPKALDAPGMWEAVRMVQSHQADVLVVASIGVLTYDTPYLFAFFQSMRENCWDLVAIEERVDTTSAAGQEALAMIEGLTRFYLMARSAEKQWDAKIKRLTYVASDNAASVEGVLDGVILRMSQFKNSGKSSLQVAQKLRNMGVKPPDGQDRWTGRLVDLILAKATACGILTEAQ